MQYFLSDNNGIFTKPLSRYTAIRLLLVRHLFVPMEFGEITYVEDENGTLHYKKAWYEKRPTKVNPYPPNNESNMSIQKVDEVVVT